MSSAEAMAGPDLMAALDRELQLVSAVSVLMSERVASISGINCTDLECLGAIEVGGVATAGDLASATGLSTGAITGVIDRLERAGYVRREADPADRRRVLVRAEPRAAEITELYEPMLAEMHALWGDYAARDIAVVLDFLARSRQLAERHLGRLERRSEEAETARPRARRR